MKKMTKKEVLKELNKKFKKIGKWDCDTMTAKERLVKLIKDSDIYIPSIDDDVAEDLADSILKEFVRREDVEMIIKKLVSIIEYPNDKEEIIDFKEFKRFALKQAKEFNGKGWVAKGE